MPAAPRYGLAAPFLAPAEIIGWFFKYVRQTQEASMEQTLVSIVVAGVLSCAAMDI